MGSGENGIKKCKHKEYRKPLSFSLTKGNKEDKRLKIVKWI